MSSCLPLALSVLLAQTPAPKLPSRDVLAKQELQRLQGSWQYESLEEDGSLASADKLKGRTIFFGADAMLQRLNGAITQGGMVSLDPTKKPKTFNAVVKKGAEQGEIMLGIYALEGDTLKICLDPQGQDRPKEFKSPAGSKLTLAVLKRVKSKDEDAEIAGDYRSESLELDGTRFVSNVTIERRGDSYLVTYKRGEAVAFIGVGLRKGSLFSMSWTDKKVVGITVYHIEKGPRLVGQWTELGGAGLLRSDVLTPGKRDLPWTRLNNGGHKRQSAEISQR